LNVVALDFETHKVITKKTFDTYGDGSASGKFVKFFKEELPAYCIIIVGVKDEASHNLSKEVKGIFRDMGSSKVSDLAFRDGWAFIGVKGMKNPNATNEKRGGEVKAELLMGYGKISTKTVKGKKQQKPQKVKNGSRIEVQSAGFTSGNFAIVKVNGEQLFTKETSSRGLNCVALDPYTHEVIAKRAYDLYGDS